MRRTVCSLSIASLFLLSSLVGDSASAAVGGPDAFGWYTFADEADGAVYNYVDITMTGTLVASGDSATGSVPLPVPFFVYGHTVTDLVANTNGFLTTDIGSTFDGSNDCPLPAAPSTGEGFRIYSLHDDLDSDVYYEYFDEVAADAIGFPGETQGVSVFQWVGTHFGGGPIDVEVVLFHDDYTILTMVAADDETGTGSTLGIQEDTASAGLTYSCETAMGLNPGATAVEFTLAPDSECCDASPGAAPGCRNIGCQATVCAMNADCCAMEWDASCAALAQTECAVLCGAPPPPVSINEIRMDQPGGDIDEYFELAGPPGTSLDGLQYIVLGDVPTAELEEVVDLTGQVIPPSGYFVVGEASLTLGVPDLSFTLSFDNLDTNTHMLVSGLSAEEFNNLDSNADGVLDFRPWDAVLDTVAIVDTTDVELPYGPVNPLGGPASCPDGPLCQQVVGMVDAPMQVYRCFNNLGPWQIGNDDPATMPATDSPGALNPCPCGDGMVDPGEDCDDMGESAMCDFDCTAAMCGDGFPNFTAGEACDDMGESAFCNDDCTLAACGDGVLNVTAGEACDDMGESATCNADCSAAACGDGIVNVTAGEECDDMGETAMCDDDCTLPMCGDMVVNTTAGETCDDGGRSETCNDDCTAVSCGDGVLNVTAGEECDDAGESETCDDDCTNAMCGDMTVNATAGEECDDGGESDACNEDCTEAACGDGVLNASAGEECDDGNTDDGDGCAADCTEEGIVDDTGGMDTTAGDDDSGSGGMATSGPSTVTNGNGSSGGDTDTDGDTDSVGSVPGDEGCNCSTGSGDTTPPWSVLALFGLGALGRRRRRHGAR